MAETWCVAFGRYLRTLRERRGLSLQEVCSLSQAFTETLNKGYLSRCENGKQSPAFSKIIPLGRIYGVPADVLLERLELDMELERVGAPETEHQTFAELTEAGMEAVTHGHSWAAYSFLRDAVPKARTAELMPRYRDQQEQIACAHMNCATVARSLGKKRFALHEFKFLETVSDLGPRYKLIVLERLSVLYRSLQQPDLAIEYAQAAIVEAENLGESNRLGYAYSNRAVLALASSDPEMAVTLFQRAYDDFKKAALPHECLRTMNNLAQAFFELGRYRASRKALHAAEKLAGSLEHHRAIALSRILLGEIDAMEHRDDIAVKRWKEAAEIAKRLNDKVLRFKAEFFLFRQAQERGDEPVARSLHRRLRKLSNWIPGDTPELASFRQLTGEDEDVAIN